MAPPVKQLLWELEEEILSRLPPQSLVRFRTVSKQWNSVFNDKSFLNNHLSRSRPQFIFITHSKVYSIEIIDPNSIDPTIELRELPIPYGEGIHLDKYKNIIRFTTCDELLFCNYEFEFEKSWTALWNPWLRHVKWNKNDAKEFSVFGLGYDNSKVYKILGYFFSIRRNNMRVALYECASHAWKFIDTPDKYWFVTHETTTRTNVSLNGNLYWVTRNRETRGDYYIRSFDFSRENFKPFCLLPCHKNHICDELILAVYKGDRFSLLKQCYVTRNIGIWVTKKKIHPEEEEDVVWINLINLPTTNLPKLSFKSDRISYFNYDKTLFMCCADDETGVACIYIVRGDLCKKIQIDSGIVECFHCVYTPNLISVP